jgi:hypothetical protein
MTCNTAPYCNSHVCALIKNCTFLTFCFYIKLEFFSGVLEPLMQSHSELNQQVAISITKRPVQTLFLEEIGRFLLPCVSLGSACWFSIKSDAK